MSTPTSPYLGKTADEISEELREHVVLGIVTKDHEEYTYDYSGTGDTYTMLCDSNASAVLVEIIRIWGVENNSFKEFVHNTDFTVDLENKQITFIGSEKPDDPSSFYVSYRYDSGIESGITDTTPGSVARTLIDGISQQIGSLFRSLDLIKVGAYIDSAVGEDLENLVELVGVTKNKATPASGYISFYRDTSAGSSTVTSGAVVGAQISNQLVLYNTLSDAVFYEGFTSCRAPIQATTQFYGKIGNMAAGNINNIVSVIDAARCNNPAYYTDYEYTQLLEGQYNYSLDNVPRRVVNSGTDPWGTLDKGYIGVCYIKDTSMTTTTWSVSTSDITITADDPATGQLKVTASVTGGNINRTCINISDVYQDIAIMARGTVGDKFNIKYYDNDASYLSTISMYEFGSTSSSTEPALNTNWTLYVGKYSAGTSTSTSLDQLRIYPNATNDMWVDVVNVGATLTESSTGATATGIYFMNYAGHRVDLYYNDENTNFFKTYDGDPTDGHQDELYIYYQWNNYISGGGEEETNEELRTRAKSALLVAAKGTKNAIKNALLDIDGIEQVEVADYNDDATIDPGICHVYVLAQGYTINPSLNQEIVDTVEDVRAAGIYAQIFSPQVRYVNFTLNVVYDDTIADYVGDDGKAALKTIIISVINDFFSNQGINEAMYISDIEGYIIYEVEGVSACWIDWNDVDTPQYSDDDYESGYTYSATVMLPDPKRITGVKTNTTIIVQRGNTVNTSAITLYRKTDKK